MVVDADYAVGGGGAFLVRFSFFPGIDHSKSFRLCLEFKEKKGKLKKNSFYYLTGREREKKNKIFKFSEY